MSSLAERRLPRLETFCDRAQCVVGPEDRLGEPDVVARALSRRAARKRRDALHECAFRSIVIARIAAS
jgi:hypothetical protein